MSDFEVSLAAVFSELRCRKGFPSTIQLATASRIVGSPEISLSQCANHIYPEGLAQVPDTGNDNN